MEGPRAMYSLRMSFWVVPSSPRGSNPRRSATATTIASRIIAVALMVMEMETWSSGRASSMTPMSAGEAIAHPPLPPPPPPRRALAPTGGPHLAYRARRRGAQFHLHLHGFDHRNRGSRAHRLAGANLHGHEQAGHRRAHLHGLKDAALFSAFPRQRARGRDPEVQVVDGQRHAQTVALGLNRDHLPPAVPLA